jgi:hypothetical protein
MEIKKSKKKLKNGFDVQKIILSTLWKLKMIILNNKFSFGIPLSLTGRIIFPALIMF